MSTGANDVFALSVDSGEILWRAARSSPITSVCCGWNNKGVTLSEDKVFIGQLDGQLVALDRATGKVAWKIQAERWQDNFSITSAPVCRRARRYRLRRRRPRHARPREAPDAKDGRLVWTFYVPAPGEPGHDTWPKGSDAWNAAARRSGRRRRSIRSSGWSFSTGNAAPDYNGAVRPGDNLYTVSMIAIELKTGKYRWHFQQVHHDIWDYDSSNPVVLMDVNMGGRTRKTLPKSARRGGAASSIARQASR